MMHLIHCIFFLEAWLGFEVVVTHVPGRENMLADDLSRNKCSSFFSMARSAEAAPTRIPLELPALLLDRDGWTSPIWTRLFFATVRAV